MPWADYSRTDFAADDALTTGRAAWLAEIHRLACEVPMDVEMAAATTTSTTWVTLFSFLWRPPDYAEGLSLYFLPEGQVTGGVGIGQIRLNIGARNGTTDAITETSHPTYADIAELPIALEAADANGSVLTVNVQGQIFDITSGTPTLGVRNLTRSTLWVAE